MTRRRAPFRLSAVCLLALSVASCGLFVSFDDYDTSTTSASFHVGGTATGLDGSPIIAHLNGGAAFAIDHDGPFTFPDTLSNGATFNVTVEQDAGRACPVQGGIGTIAGRDVTNVEIHCSASAVALSSLVLSAATLSPPFEPQITRYTAKISTLFSDTFTVTARARDPLARVQVGDQQVDAGVPSNPIAVKPGTTMSVDVVVTSPAGTSQRTTIEVTAGDPIKNLLKAPTRMDGAFGSSVAISGDTIVVGSPKESTTQGAAYVFVRDGETFRQEARLNLPVAPVAPVFGASVAVSGDTLVVGAVGAVAVDGTVRAGAVYVFTRSDGAWSTPVQLAPPNAEINDGFGNSVAIAGETIVVGAAAKGAAGAAYVFTKNGTSWSQQQLPATGLLANDEFGSSVAIAGDTIAVGAPHSDGKQPAAAYIFRREGGTWSQEARLTEPNPVARPTHFGQSVAVLGDTLLVGTPNRSSSAGVLFLFTRTTAATWEPDPSGPIDPGGSKSFGTAVAITNQAFAVGGPFESVGSVSTGAAYLYTRGAAASVLKLHRPAETPDSEEKFGWSVALSSDALVVGAPGDPSCAKGVDPEVDDAGTLCPSSGAVFVYR